MRSAPLFAALAVALVLCAAPAAAQEPLSGGAGIPENAPSGGAGLSTPAPTGGAEVPPPPAPPPVAAARSAPPPPPSVEAAPSAKRTPGNDEDVEADVPVPKQEAGKRGSQPQAPEANRVLGLASTGFAAALLGFFGLVLGVAGLSLRRAAGPA